MRAVCFLTFPLVTLCLGGFPGPWQRAAYAVEGQCVGTYCVLCDRLIPAGQTCPHMGGSTGRAPARTPSPADRASAIVTPQVQQSLHDAGYNLGYALGQWLFGGNTNSAATAAARARALRLNLQGIGCCNNEQWNRAVEYFRAALANCPRDPHIRRNYELAMEGLRAREEALRKQEEARRKDEQYNRLAGALKLEIPGSLALKGIEGEGGLKLKGIDSGSDLTLKLISDPEKDENLRPKGTPFFGLGGDAATGPGPAMPPAPSLAELRANFGNSRYIAVAVESAPPADVDQLLDLALRAANGDKSALAGVPAGAAAPVPNEKALLAFHKADISYTQAEEARTKCLREFEEFQRRRDFAGKIAEARIAELTKAMAREKDPAGLKRLQDTADGIRDALRAEDAAWAKAKARLVAADSQTYSAKEEAVRLLRAAALGKDPDTFHPPIASLPSLDEGRWRAMQNQMIVDRKRLDEQMSRILAAVDQMHVPAPAPALTHMHEGVILGFRTDGNDAANMEADAVSPFTGRTYREMNAAAERARREGRDLGGAMVVSFGTPYRDEHPVRGEPTELWRIYRDHVTQGEHSLETPQGREAVERMNGKHFDRLVAHSNGAAIAEALIRKDIIKVDELDIAGGDGALLRGDVLQKLVDSGKVKRVRVWINIDDPVPILSSVDQLRTVERTPNYLEHVHRRVTGNLAGGDSSVEYHFMWGRDRRPTASPIGTPRTGFDLFEAHYYETAYAPQIARELGTRGYSFPARVMEGR